MRSIDKVNHFKNMTMKKILFIWLLSGLFISTTTAQYDDALPTGYEGDNFSLEGALDLFKNSYSLEQFERKLNTRDNWVNNLDLNFDGRTDYIRVEHRRQGDFHAIILQALVGSWEVQDVAVIEIEKVSRRDAVLQIIGDEDLYGEEVIVEAYDRNTLVRDRGYNRSNYGYRTSYVNVWNWSPIQFIFGRNYVRYVSPFNHHYYPTWWSPWNRCGWDVFRPRIVHYHAYYRPVRIHRVINVHRFYRPTRTYCNAVVNRSNKVRKKHGKRTIERPRVKRKNVDRNKGLTSRGQKGDRKNIRKRDKATYTKNRSLASRTDARATARDRSVSTKNRKDSKYTSKRKTSRKEVSSRPSRGTSTVSKRTKTRTKTTYGNSGRKKSKTKTTRSKSYTSKSAKRSSSSRVKSASSSRKVSRPSSKKSSYKKSSKSTSKKSSRSSKVSKRSSSKKASSSKRGKRKRN